MTVPGDEVNKPRGRYWWLTLLRGVFALGLGMALLVPYFDSQNNLLTFMAMYWLISGISSMSWGIRGAKRKGLWFLAGILGITGGFVILIRPRTTAIINPVAFPIMFGIIAVCTGLIHIFGGFQLSQTNERRWSWTSFLLGVVEVGLGVMILISPAEIDPAVRWAAAAWATVGGIGLISLSLRQRKIASAY